MRQKELEEKGAARQGRIAPELLFQFENLFHVLKVTIQPISRRPVAPRSATPGCFSSS